MAEDRSKPRRFLSGRKIMALSITSRICVLTLLCLLAMMTEYINYKVVHNHARLVELDEVRTRAVAFAQEVAESAPLAVASIRQTMRGHLADAIRDVTAHELAEQHRLQQTNDFAEGIRATAERRMPNFKGD